MTCAHTCFVALLLPVIGWWIVLSTDASDRAIRSQGNKKSADGDGRPQSCIREFEGFRLAGELPITRLPTRLRRDCIVSCIRSNPPCSAAVFDKRKDVTQSSCVLYANNTVVVKDKHLKLVPSRDQEGETMTVFEILPECPQNSDQTHTIAVHHSVPKFASLLEAPKVSRNIDDANWASWSTWTQCSLECGGGDQFRLRKCTNCASDRQPQQQQARRCNTQPCGIDRLSVRNTYGTGVQSWSQWSEWTSCYQASGSGSVSTRSRTCPNYGGCGDENQSVESRPCDQGVSQSTSTEWQTWGSWSQCTATCGDGTQQRYRTCAIIEQFVRPAPQTSSYNAVQPAPATNTNYNTNNNVGYRRRQTRQTYGGGGNTGGVTGGTTTQCPGSSIDSQSCNAGSCPTWLAWGAWGSCTVTCGNGRRERTRSCDQGNRCFGQNVESQPCGEPCTDWSTWTSWSQCTVTCGHGQKKRTRQCQVSSPVNSVSGTTSTSYGSSGGSSNSYSNQGSSNFASRPNYPPQPAPAPYRNRNRQRIIQRNKRQSYGGGGSAGASWPSANTGTSYNVDLAPGKCPGNSEEVTGCEAGACPSWGPWKDWSLCSVSCGQGTQSRSRDCENGYGCTGDQTQTQNCDCGACPSWGNWGNWGSCSATCDYGSQSRTRTCDNYDIHRAGHCQPASNVPNGGVEYATDNTNYNSYATNTGSGGGNYGGFVAVRAVHRSRSRIKRQYNAGSSSGATFPSSNNYGTSSNVNTNTYGSSGTSSYVSSTSDACSGGKTVEYKACKEGTCPQWGAWGQWSSCSTSCGAGQITRGRQCNGDGCAGDDAEQRFCENPPCCEWNEWQQWSSCSVTCGEGARTRTRTNNQQSGSGGAGGYGGSTSGFPCDGPSSEVDQCTGSGGATCTQQCQWATWNAWGSCSVTCGTGTQVRTRQCSCYGDCGSGQTTETQSCNSGTCDQFVGGGYGPAPAPVAPSTNNYGNQVQQGGYRRQRQRIRQRQRQRQRQTFFDR